MVDNQTETLPLADERTRVVFLGAGFSRCAGLPIMREFGATTKDELAALRSKVNKQPEKSAVSCAQFIDAGDAYSALATSLSAKPPPGLDPTNVEHVFCLVEALKQLGVEHIDLPGHERVATTYLDRSIRLWLWKIYQKLPIFDKPDSPLCEKYAAFFELFGPIEVRRTAAFITTNYDLLVDWQLWKTRIPAIPAWHAHATPLSLVKGAGLYSHKDDAPILCKLHGSVNCFTSNTMDPDKCYFCSDTGDGVQTVGSSGSLNRHQIVILAEWSLVALERRFGMQLTPAVVPPVFHKNTSAGWIRMNWIWAFESLRRATEIVFVGYGFPESDGPVRSLIQAAMCNRATTKQPHVTIVDPDEKVLAKYQSFFPFRVHPIECGFEQVETDVWREALGFKGNH